MQLPSCGQKLGRHKPPAFGDHRRWLWLGLAVVVVVLSAHSAGAADRIVLRASTGSGTITLPCQIVDWTGREITVRLRSSSEPKKYPAEQVIAVETSKGRRHALGEELYRQGRVADAQRAFEEALRQEPRVWVRRQILAMLVRCAVWQGDYVAAGERFLALVRSDPMTQYFGTIPLAWNGPSSASAALRSRARVWLGNSSDTARLLGASFLLTEVEAQTQAHEVLKELARSRDDRVRSLARAQQWRARLQSGDVGRLELAHWEEDIERMPQGIRGGPYFVLGLGHELRREFDLAATAYLWVPLVYDENPRLAAHALLRAAECLAKMGNSSAAERLQREVIARFPKTKFAETAASRLKLTP
ncbi:MAG: tetratricopeptide repeat protein, partial [Planctomycetes bacterium]|nr:tetratricopeptide repeat protein [Planctomycetota bacterium]